MGDQGAGGGIESHMPTHRRQDSSEEPMPAEPAPETRNPPPESDAQDLTQAPQDLPRGSRDLGANGQARGGPGVNATPGLSRNPSTCSTNSNAKPNHEYLTAHTPGLDRPFPGTRPSSFIANRPLEPPVTRQTLSELDVTKIVHNPKLRHDINFDPDLHFRPNLDGEKGRRKQEKANQFWSMLLEQLVMFVMDRDAFQMNYGSGDWCLPSLLRAVREIVETLVPQRDRELLNEGLNIDLLMQQFNRGVADLEKLASWLSGVLKLHCAPMRDEWVDEMYQELSNGNRNNDMAELVKGMRSLLSVLEAMKLDVANHQIRCLRPVLIEDTVHFEQRFFLKKIESRKLSIAPSRMWYLAARDQVERLYGGSPIPHLNAFGEMTVFFEALSRLVLPSTSAKVIPPTFLFDEDRIVKLRSDMHDSICLEICMRKYEDLERLSRVTQPCHRIPSYVNDEPPTNNRFSGDFNFLAPTTSRPSSLAFSDRGSNFSSPRTSGLFAQPSTDFAESRSKASELYNSLLALLHTAPSAGTPDGSSTGAPAPSPAKRWRNLSDSMALQILRYANAPFPLPGFEKQLSACLEDVHSDVFCEVEQQFQQRLLAELARRVNEFKNLSGLALFSVATGSRAQGSSRSGQLAAGPFGDIGGPRDPREEAGIDDIAIRLAHLGVLHWRVWAPLAYEGDIEGELNALQNQAQGCA
ncbi:Protein SOK1 [Madurella mycetomatis]|uniref:Protein SOK1 n=1 Tax=Madurella mycetomatis TaxID=100816 RepID=A0A175VTP5_9PEZI|nr:Protein SOK1 [Madurella mycetomatis]